MKKKRVQHSFGNRHIPIETSRAAAKSTFKCLLKVSNYAWSSCNYNMVRSGLTQNNLSSYLLRKLSFIDASLFFLTMTIIYYQQHTVFFIFYLFFRPAAQCSYEPYTRHVYRVKISAQRARVYMVQIGTLMLKMKTRISRAD
jgi:hypothetical protein